MRLAVFADVFPELSETFVINELRAMVSRGHELCVVTAGHPQHPNPPQDLDLPVTVLDDLPRGRKAAALGALLARHPRACARDRADLGTWRVEEFPRSLAALAPVARDLERRGVEHIHVHFAMGAALEALRIGRLLGVPVSITAHAYDIFLRPRNLPEKLRRAAFVTTGCAYNVAHLRSLAGPAAAGRIHEMIMGVDGDVFRRRTAHPQDRHVVAIGRLVEKKGFADLIEASARLHADGLLDRLTIVGEGPLERPLRERVEALGVGDRVDLEGALTPQAIRNLLEDAAVLAMPCVIAPDGDRDSMPVVVKEALAMEVPVVATDEVGLPELVDDTCGRLVAPHDPAALAEGLAAVLRMSAGERAALGRAGRERVLDRCNLAKETDRLLDLISDAVKYRR